jgi:hypothetical protein
MLASLRFIYAEGTGSDHRSGTPTSYSELMGFPDDQLTTEYWFPWYNNGNMWSQLRFGNPNAVDSTTVSVYLGTSLLGSYPLGPSQSMRIDYPGVNGGPIRVVSSGGVPIIAAERIIYSDGNGSVQNGNHTSYYELMGFPGNQLTTEYWIPWYNNGNMWAQLRFANPSTVDSTTVSVYLGPTLLGSFMLGPSESTRVDFPGVRIVSSGGVPIIAAERIIYSEGGVHTGTHTSYSELMAIPGNQLTSSYWFPSYSYPDGDTWSQLRFGNPSASLSTTVEVHLGGALMGTYALGPSESLRIDYLGQDNGPLEVSSTDDLPIIAAVRVIQKVAGVQTSYSELTGYPGDQLASTYWFPWYNNGNFDTQLRMAVP